MNKENLNTMEEKKEKQIETPDGLIPIEQEIHPDLFKEAQKILAEQEKDFDQKIKDILRKNILDNK